MAEQQQQQQGEGDEEISASRVLTALTVAPLGGALFFFSLLTLIATLIALAVVAPLFFIVSPVLVPAALVVGLLGLGFFASGVFGAGGLTSLWSALCRMWKLSVAQLEHAKRRAEDTVGEMGHKAQQAMEQVAQKAQDVGQEVQETMMAEPDQHPGKRHDMGLPSATGLLAPLTLFPVCNGLLFFSGIVFVATVVGVVIVTPLLVLFSPVLVPAAFAIGLAITGFFVSGAFGTSGVLIFWWIAAALLRRFRSTLSPERMEHGTPREESMGQKGQKARETAGQEGEKAQEAGGQVGRKAHETEGQVRQKAHETTGKVGQKAQETGGRKGQKGQDVGQKRKEEHEVEIES